MFTVKELKKEIEEMPDDTVVIFEDHNSACVVNESFSIDKSESRFGFLILISHP